MHPHRILMHLLSCIAALQQPQNGQVDLSVLLNHFGPVCLLHCVCLGVHWVCANFSKFHQTVGIIHVLVAVCGAGCLSPHLTSQF